MANLFAHKELILEALSTPLREKKNGARWC